MAGKIFEIAFRISGALNSQFASSMCMAQSSMQSLSAVTVRNNAAMSSAGRGLQSYLVNLNRLSASAENFVRLKRAVTESNNALKEAQIKANQLASAYRQQQRASGQLKTRVDQLKASYEAQKNSLPKDALRALRNELKTATAEWKAQEQAKQLGSTTQFTMTQAAEAMGYLGMAGWKTEQIYGTLPGMLNLAAGAGTDLARTADIVSDNMTAMGVPVEKAGHFMDVYAYALSNANVDLEALGETMKYAAPIASAFGASLEDTAEMTMMMGNAGVKGSMAGTALRMLTQVVRPA